MASGTEFAQTAINKLLSDCDDMTPQGSVDCKPYKLDFTRDNSPTLVDPSWNVILTSSLRYTVKQFSLEKRNACIGCTIITFIVCMASFIFVFF